MAGGPGICSSPDDYGDHISFFAQVRNNTNSIYPNLYFNYPLSLPGIATLTSTHDESFFLACTINQACNRQCPLVQIKDNTEYAVQIVPNAAGRAALNVLSNKQTPADANFWTIITGAFYVTSTVEPLSLAIPNVGSYYACTDGLGTIGVYFRLNTTTAPSTCEDIVMDVILGFE